MVDGTVRPASAAGGATGRALAATAGTAAPGLPTARAAGGEQQGGGQHSARNQADPPAGGASAAVGAARGAASVTAVIAAPPPGLTTLAPGDVIAATVAARATDGALTLTTAHGQVTVATTTQALAPGTPVQLLVVATDQGLRVQIQVAQPAVAVETVPGSGPGSVPGSGPGSGPGAAPVGPAAATGLGVGAVLTGRFVPSPLPLHAAAQPAAATAAIPAVPSGSAAVAAGAPHQPNASLPAARTAAAGSGVSATAAVNAPARPGALPGTPGTTARPAAAAIAGGVNPAAASPLTVRVLATAAPGAPAMVAAQALTGTVLATAAAGQTAIQTSSGVLILAGTSDLPAGSQVLLQVVARPGTVVPASVADRQVQLWRTIANGWPALDEVIEAVQAAAPEAAARLVAGALPQTGPRLATGIVFFMAALFGGRLQDWLGNDLARVIERAGRPALMARLRDEFGHLGRLANEPVSSDWRVVPLPLLHNGVVEQLRLYLRRDRADRDPEAARDNKSTRFVIEAQLSRLGALQLDGLVGPRRFDLIIRSHAALPADLRQAIGALFRQAGTDTDFVGGIAFQTAAVFPVAPLDQIDGHAIGLFA